MTANRFMTPKRFICHGYSKFYRILTTNWNCVANISESRLLNMQVSYYKYKTKLGCYSMQLNTKNSKYKISLVMAKLHGKRVTLILRHSAKYFSFWQIVSMHVLRSGQQIRQQTRILPQLSNLSDWIPCKWISTRLITAARKILVDNASWYYSRKQYRFYIE